MIMEPPPLKVRRVEVERKRPFYLVWPPDGRPPIELHNVKRTQEFLEKEGLLGVVALDSFDFKSSTPRKQKCSSASPLSGKPSPRVPLSQTFAHPETEERLDGEATTAPSRFNLQNILKKGETIAMECFTFSFLNLVLLLTQGRI